MRLEVTETDNKASFGTRQGNSVLCNQQLFRNENDNDGEMRGE